MISTYVTPPLLPLSLPPAACAASSATAASTPAVTCVPTCAYTHWTSPSSAVSATAASASHPLSVTMCACTRESAPTSATSARAHTPSWQGWGRTKRAPGTGRPTQGLWWACRPTRPHLHLLSWHRFLTRSPWCITFLPWCYEIAWSISDVCNLTGCSSVQKYVYAKQALSTFTFSGCFVAP